jgi:NAD dependent epimerase/dehydratase family enzyme
MAELLVKGQRVAPERLRDAGFEFRHPAIEETLTDLLAK